MPEIPSDHWLLNPSGDDDAAIVEILAESAADMASYEARAADMASYEAGAAPRASSLMAELHRRWAALVDERSDLGVLEGDADTIADADGRVGVRWYNSKETARRQGPVLYSDEEIAAEAHRRRSAVWATGDDERIECERIECERIERERIETREALAAHHAEADKIAGLGGPAAVAARYAAVGDEIDALLDAIEAQPARTPYDVAVLLDVALEYGDSPCFLSDVFWAIEAQRAVAALAPGFRFTFYDRYFERVERDVVGLPTEAAAAADCAPAPADVLPAEGVDEQPSPTLVRREAGETAELVRQAAALAADYAGPLPAGPGDAGLVEAERRRDALVKGITALSRAFRVTGPEEDEIINRGVYYDEDAEATSPGAVEQRLWQFIVDTAPEGVAGIAVKLRLLLPFDEPDTTEGFLYRQCINAATRLAAG